MQAGKIHPVAFVIVIVLVFAMIILSAATQNYIGNSQLSGITVQSPCLVSAGILAVAATVIFIITRTIGPVIVPLPQEPAPLPHQELLKQTTRRTFRFTLILGGITLVLISLVFCSGLLLVTLGSEQQVERVVDWFENAPGFGRPLEAPELAQSIGILPGLLLPLAGISGSIIAFLGTWNVIIPHNKLRGEAAKIFTLDVASNPSLEMEKISEELAALGFLRLGKLDGDPNQHWIFASEDQEISMNVSMSATPGVSEVVITSFFADGTLLETRSPTGTKIRLPNYYSNVSPLNLTYSVAIHKRHLANFRVKQGDPVKIASLEDYQREAERADKLHRAEYLETYNRALLAPPLSSLILNLAALVTMTILYPVALDGGIACIVPFLLMPTYWSLNLAALVISSIRKIRKVSSDS